MVEPLSILNAKLVDKSSRKSNGKTQIDSWTATMQVQDAPDDLLASVDDGGLTLLLGLASDEGFDNPIDTITLTRSQCKTVGKKVICKGNKLSVTFSAAAGKKAPDDVIVKAKANSRELDMPSSTSGPIAMQIAVPTSDGTLYFGGQTRCKQPWGSSQHTSLVCGAKY